MLSDKLNSPVELVLNSLSWWMAARPQFKILNSIIVSNAIFMMNRFFLTKPSANGFFHHQNMLKNPVIWRDINDNISTMVFGFSTLPSGMVFSLHSVTKPVKHVFAPKTSTTCAATIA